MTITETPKVKISRANSSMLRIGNGTQIPIFIGVTGNSTAATGILQFKKFSEADRTIAAGGIGTDESNQLRGVLKDFFEESLKINADDIGVPYVYAKDMGTGSTSSATAWVNAVKDAKSKRTVQVEAYVFQKVEGTTPAQIVSIMESVAAAIDIDATKGNPRIAYFTVLGYTDDELRALTKTGEGSLINHSGVGLITPEKFGKHLARICCTPYYDKPGYYVFRSIGPEEFTERTDENEENLQAAGVIFGHDEKPGSQIYPKINLACSTAWAIDLEDRPKDALLHVRRNVDQLIREAVETVYPQLKRRQTQSFLSMTQADLDVLVNSKIKEGYMKEGTQLVLREVEDDKLAVDVYAYPIKATGLITMTVYIDEDN